MDRRASRAAIFAAVVAGHLLVLHFLPDFHVPQEVSDREPSLPITIFPVELQQARPAASRARPPFLQPQTAAASSRRTKRTPGERKPLGERKQETANRTAPGSAVSAAPRHPGHVRGVRPWIDWEKQADAAVAEQSEQAAEAAHRASALSRWREHVMPGPVPPRPEFRWDYAATHRLQSTPGGLVININDRCFIVTNGLFVLPVCRIGQIPAYGDLFAHMDDPKEPGDSSVP